MLVRFWGTRGSLPVALEASTVRSKVRKALLAASGRAFADDAELDRFIDEELPLPVRHTYGGNSPCVQIETGGSDYVLCDMGSGLRKFGQVYVEGGGLASPSTFHIFMSHVHWDHIMGFPFFVPAYVPGNTIRIYGCHDVLEEALRKQQSAPCFPVDFDLLGATIEFVRLEADATHEVAGLTVTTKTQRHSGGSFGYRFEKDGQSIVYSTDSEHTLEQASDMDEFIEFFRDADIVVFDAMYSLAEATSVKEDWGHSSNIVGVDLCHRAGVKRYCLFHHEPLYDDEMIYEVYHETVRYEELMREDHALEIITAYDGLEIEL